MTELSSAAGARAVPNEREEPASSFKSSTEFLYGRISAFFAGCGPLSCRWAKAGKQDQWFACTSNDRAASLLWRLTAQTAGVVELDESALTASSPAGRSPPLQKLTPRRRTG